MKYVSEFAAFRDHAEKVLATAKTRADYKAACVKLSVEFYANTCPQERAMLQTQYETNRRIAEEDLQKRLLDFARDKGFYEAGYVSEVLEHARKKGKGAV